MSSIRCHLPPEKLDCWHNCDRRQAAQLLLGGGCKPGTFLLRPCHSRVERYALSVLHENRQRGIRGLFQLGRCREPVVRNYLIKEKSGGYYIYADQCFKDMQYLLAYYAKPRRRMHTALQFPLPRSERPAAAAATEVTAAKQLQADRGKQLHLMQKIGVGSYEMYSAELNGRQVVSLVLDGGREIAACERPEGAASWADASSDDEGVEKTPPLPPRPTPTQPAASVSSKKQPPADSQQPVCCLQKTAKSTEMLSGSGVGRNWTSVVRDRLGRCSMLADRMLQALFK